MQLVKEHINFERGVEPKQAMGIGMEEKLRKFIKHLQLEGVSRKWLVSYAAGAGRTDLVEFLLNSEEGDPNYHNGAPLIQAAAKGHLDIIKLLVKYGAKLNVDHGQPLIYAMNHSHPDAFELLLQLGADPDEGFVFQNSAKFDPIYKELINKYN